MTNPVRPVQTALHLPQSSSFLQARAHTYSPSPTGHPRPALHRSSLALAVAVGITALAACSGAPPRNADIAAARSAVQTARSDPAVTRNAPLELEQADQALTRAENAWAEERDEEQARHLAYLAGQRATIATNLGGQRQIEQEIRDTGAERERVRTEAERRRAAAATAAAVSAQQSAAVARQQAAAQTARAALLQSELEALQARQTERGMVVTLPDVLFTTGGATLNPGAQLTVDRLANVLQQYPERRVLIEGYTDNVGSAGMNKDLSRRRAESFRRALANRGVAPRRMEVRAYGENYPLADNGSAAGRAQNRRVEVVFSDADGKLPVR